MRPSAFPPLSFVLLLVAAGCGGGVKVMGAEEPAYPGAAAHHEHTRAVPEGSLELPSDEQIVEPDHPLVDTKTERATVHVHTPRAVCSGVVVGPRLIVTARRCVTRELRGPQAVGEKEDYKVEIASSSLTWTNRKVSHVAVASCKRSELDVAVLVLAEPVPWVQPLRVLAAPGPGAKVQAVGFGRCGPRNTRDAAVLSRDGEDFVIDVPLCKGDVGGPVVDGRDGELVGLVSHQDDPEGSPRKTTTIARVDSTPARALVAQAERLAKGADAKAETPIVCD